MMVEYFKDWENKRFSTTPKEFDPQKDDPTKSYDPYIAWWLAQCSKVSYEIKRIASQELKKAGFSNVIFFDTKGTQAFLAEHPGNGDGPFAVLAFRGTEQDSVDILTDISFWGRVFPDENLVQDDAPQVLSPPKKKQKLFVHGGFLEGVLNVWGNELRPEVKEVFPGSASSWIGARGISNAICDLGDRSTAPLYFTGHSLGGALATIAAYKALVYKKRVNFAGLYTFGSPRTVQEAVAEKINNQHRFEGRLFRVVNHNDIVPRVPLHVPPLFEFQHVDHLIYYGADRKRQQGFSTPQIAWMDTLVVVQTLFELVLWAITALLNSIVRILTLNKGSFYKHNPTTIGCHMIDRYIADIENDL